MKVFFLSLLSTFLLHGSLTAQSPLIPKYEVGILGGIFVYQGDLTPNPVGATNTMKPGFGVYGTKTLNRYQGIRLQIMRGWLKGDESTYNNPAWRQQRNLFFKSPVTELSGLYIWHPLGLNANEAGIINFSPYLFGGISYSFLNIKRDWSRFNYTHFAFQPEITNGLAADINHKIPKGTFSFPLGAGIRYGISEKFSFQLETTYRISNTDYLDGFSQAANPDKKDHYHTITAGLIYSFGKRNLFDCPVIKN